MSPTTQAEVGSTGSSTPATATPGSAGSVGATSPQWAFPGGAQQSGSPSPLTVTFTEQHVRQHEKLASDQPVIGPKPMLAAARPTGVQPHVENIQTSKAIAVTQWKIKRDFSIGLQNRLKLTQKDVLKLMSLLMNLMKKSLLLEVRVLCSLISFAENWLNLLYT